ncbi:MAG TPA: PP2C family serine/threonine-protein phosphatase [Polyangiaceae bacterium]|nr:PP2C family serine/threonine-protein phosphatase [Polyangiaceae bacterium]
MRSFAGTHVGQRRKNNEDAFLLDDDLGLWVVADGMGGQAAGEVASQQAVETVHEMVRGSTQTRESQRPMPLGASATPPRVTSRARVLESAIQAATYMVFGMAELDRSKTGMGTTLSAMWGTAQGALLGQVGDSRIYRVREGRAEQLTEDHTLINWQLRQGLITEEEAKTSKQKNVITRAVGNKDYVQVDILEVDVQFGDVFLLCSDGLHGYLETDEIPALVEGGGDTAVQALIDLANGRGGKDNITVALVVAEPTV